VVREPAGPAPTMPAFAGAPRLALVLAAALFVTTSGAEAATYYVDNQSAACSNAGPGTEAQPYCSIGAALAAHNGPGETIIVKPGVYREQVNVPASGSSLAPFVISASGPGVVVDGADDFSAPGLWTPSSGTVFLAASVTWSPRQVFVDGSRLTPSVDAPGQLASGAFTWVSGQGLYVNLGGDNPGSRETRVGRRNYGFNVFSKSWVTIDGFEVTGTEDRGIYLQNPCADLVIARNRVSFANSYGIHSVNGTRLLLEENVVSDCNFHGIGLTGGTNDCTLLNNESFRNADPAIRRANGIYMYGSPRNTLSGNRLHDNQDSGVNFTQGSDSCLSFNNRSWNNGDHGYDHLHAVGTIHMHDVAFGNYKDGFSIEGVSPNSQLHNCIAVNNGLTTDEYDLWVNLESSQGFVSDYNIFWNSTTQVPIKFITTTYATLAGYQAASGQDEHSFQADPRFANGPSGDFQLLAGSPAIDAATSALPNWPETDAMGNSRVDDAAVANLGTGPIPYADIGALEAEGGLDLAPVVLCPSSLQAPIGRTVTFTVLAFDPNGDPIQSLIMKTLKWPKRSGETFTVNETNTVGTFTWSVPNVKQSTYTVQFTASNALSSFARTSIAVTSASGSGNEGIVGVGDEDSETGISFSGAYPNPSRDAVEFNLELPSAARVEWAVHDLQGRAVWHEERDLMAGHSTLRWEGVTMDGRPAATGVYLVRARVGATQFTRRVVRFF